MSAKHWSGPFAAMLGAVLSLVPIGPASASTFIIGAEYPQGTVKATVEYNDNTDTLCVKVLAGTSGAYARGRLSHGETNYLTVVDYGGDSQKTCATRDFQSLDGLLVTMKLYWVGTGGGTAYDQTTVSL
jgi:hypothetical protein